MIGNWWLEISIVGGLVAINTIAQLWIEKIGTDREGQKGVLFLMKWNGVRMCSLMVLVILVIISGQVAVVPFSIIFLSFYLLTIVQTIYCYGTNIK